MSIKQRLFMLIGRIFGPRVDITRTTFAARACLVKRQTINVRDIMNPDFWQAAHKAVNDYAGENGLALGGPGLALYFSMDMETGMTDFGIGQAVENADAAQAVTAPGLELARIGETKALTAVVRGHYSKLGFAHGALWRYCQKNNLKQVWPVVEEYIVDPTHTPDAKKWETNIYCLYTQE